MADVPEQFRNFVGKQIVEGSAAGPNVRSPFALPFRSLTVFEIPIASGAVVAARQHARFARE